jgi:uncharacterized integral membrane protein
VSDHVTDPKPATSSSDPILTGDDSRSAKPGKSNKSGDPLRHSRTSAAWTGVVGLGVVLVLLIIFIAQNTPKAEVNFLGWSGTAPQSVALLIATAAGLLIAVIAASLRILQLRRRVKKTR